MTKGTVLRYAAIFWLFYELFMVLLLTFHTRAAMDGGVEHIALYALTGGAINLLFTMVLFRALEALSAREAGRMAERSMLTVIILATVMLMMSADAALRLWFDGAPATAFGGYWLELLQQQFHDSLITVAFLTGLGNALRSWAGEEKRKIRESELRTAIARAEIEAVAAHLRPAVVAEALRGIGAEVERDPARARALTLQLANNLRASFGR